MEKRGPQSCRKVSVSFLNTLRTSIYNSSCERSFTLTWKSMDNTMNTPWIRRGNGQINERSTGLHVKEWFCQCENPAASELHCSCVEQQIQSEAADALRTLKSSFPYVFIAVFKISFYNCIVAKSVCFKIAF